MRLTRPEVCPDTRSGELRRLMFWLIQTAFQATTVPLVFDFAQHETFRSYLTVA